MDLLQRAIAIDPLSADNYYNLSITLNHAGRQDEAIAAARKVLQISPDYAAAHAALAVAYLALSRPQDALRKFSAKKIQLGG